VLPQHRRGCTKSSEIVRLLSRIMASPTGTSAISQGCGRNTGIGLTGGVRPGHANPILELSRREGRMLRL
jgi:hypothetical protein